jgi:glycosyltransferase involved in cell wall biosynthesis
MADNTKTIWIDLTMLAHWQGQLTGIQRVEYNLARRFAQKPYVRFCIFDKTQRAFFEHDFSDIEAKVTALQEVSALVAAAGGRSSYLRRAVAPRLPDIAKKPLKSAYRLVNQRTKRRPQSKPLALGRDDKLLILSGDWSDEIFATAVTEMKNKIGFQLVQIVYDLLPAVQPAFFVPGMPEQVATYMSSIFKISDGILAISEATKKDVLSFQAKNKLPKCEVKVFRLGEDFVGEEPLKPRLSIEPGNFLLCVGTVEARKNHMVLYFMVREAIRRGDNLPPIVIAGKHGWLADNFIYLVNNDQVISKKIIFLPDGTDRELAWLFQNCLLTLYPSFYEGWGLPIAESLFYGKLCLSSNASSMPEIAGDLIDYYSPNSPDEILDSIVKYLKDPQLLKKKEADIKQKYVPTGWDATFKQVEDYLLKV